MFQVGDTVVHQGVGLCTIADIRKEEFSRGNCQTYYVLQPQSDTSTTLFVPVEGEKVRLRTVMTAEQAEALPEQVAAYLPVWSDNERERQDTFARILRGGEPAALARLVLDVKQQERQRYEQGKKLRFTDERAMQEAARLLKQELAVVLNISPEHVISYLAGK